MTKVWKAVKSSLNITREDNFYRWMVLLFGWVSGDAGIHGWWNWAGMFFGLMLVSLVEYSYATKKQNTKDRTTAITFYGDLPNKETMEDLIKKAKIQRGF